MSRFGPEKGTPAGSIPVGGRFGVLEFEFPAGFGDGHADQLAILVIFLGEVLFQFRNAVFVSADSFLERCLHLLEAVLEQLDFGFRLTLDSQKLLSVGNELLDKFVRQPTSQMGSKAN